MKYTVFILFFYLPFLCDANVCTLVEKRGDGAVVLETTTSCSPGTIVLFEVKKKRLEFMIDKKITASRYLAISRNPIFNSILDELQLGAQSVSFEPVHCFENGKASSFWLNLRNPTINKKRESRLMLINSESERKFVLKGSSLILLDLHASLEGYLCLLEIDTADNIVHVLFPFSKEHSEKLLKMGVSNLTYSENLSPQWDTERQRRPKIKPAFIEIGLESSEKQADVHHFVALISAEPRPLSDFLPDNHQAIYQDKNGNKIAPNQIGPGYIAPVQGKSIRVQNVNYISAGDWVIANLPITIL